MQIQLTDHAKHRMQQRCIPLAVIDWLLDFGEREKSGNCEIVYFNKKSKKLLAKELGKEIVKSLSKYLNAFAVVGKKNQIVTTGYRNKHIYRA